MLPWGHPSLESKRHLDRFSRFCTAHRRVSRFTNGPLPLKIALSHGHLDPHILHGSLCPPESSAQIKRHLDRFSRFYRVHYSHRPTDHATRQGCGLGLDVSVSRRSRDVSTSRLGLVSTKIVNVSVSSRSRPLTSRARDQFSAKFCRSQ